MRNVIQRFGPVEGPICAPRAAKVAAALAALLVFAVYLSSSRTAEAQEPGSTSDVAADGEPPVLSAQALEELAGPIALYPDDLVGVVLPASTYPLQIVEAARFLEARESDSRLEPDEDWDDSVVALLNYPEVIELMNNDLDWTWSLGEAVLYQRAELLNAIQRFRDQAYAAGNLRSDDRQVVRRDEGVIAIAPADPEVIYIPYYEPRRVIVYQSVPAYDYYPYPYPVYYYPYPASYSFRSGFFWGVTSAFVVGWHSHYLHVHHHNYHAHPYFGRRYYDPFYFRRGVNVTVNVNHVHNVWQPRHRHGARPNTRVTRSFGSYRGPERNARATRVTRTTAGSRVGGTADSRRLGTTRSESRPSGGSSERTFSGIDRRQSNQAGSANRSATRATPRIEAEARARTQRSTQTQRRAQPQRSERRSLGGIAQSLRRTERTTLPRTNAPARAAAPRTTISSRSAPRQAAPRATNRGTTSPVRAAAGRTSAPRATDSGSSRSSRTFGGVTNRSDSRRSR